MTLSAVQLKILIGLSMESEDVENGPITDAAAKDAESVSTYYDITQSLGVQ